MGQKDTGKWGGGIRGGGGGKDVKQGKGKVSRIQKWKHGRPLYLELLKIAQQMVAGASWTNAPLSPFRPMESIGWELEGRLPGACSQQLLRGGYGESGEERRVEWSGNYFLHCLTKYGQGGGETRHRSSPAKRGQDMFRMLLFPQSANRLA